MNIEHDYLTPPEVSGIIRKPIKSMAVDRCLRRDHPPYLKIGRKILYRRSDVLAWLEAESNSQLFDLVNTIAKGWTSPSGCTMKTRTLVAEDGPWGD